MCYKEEAPHRVLQYNLLFEVPLSVTRGGLLSASLNHARSLLPLSLSVLGCYCVTRRDRISLTERTLFQTTLVHRLPFSLQGVSKLIC